MQIKRLIWESVLPTTPPNEASELIADAPHTIYKIAVAKSGELGKPIQLTRTVRGQTYLTTTNHESVEHAKSFAQDDFDRAASQYRIDPTDKTIFEKPFDFDKACTYMFNNCVVRRKGGHAMRWVRPGEFRYVDGKCETIPLFSYEERNAKDWMFVSGDL